MAFSIDKSNPDRGAIMLPMGYSRKHPNIIIPFQDIDKSRMTEMIIAECEKQGLTAKEAEIVVEAAEAQYEERMKVKEAQVMLRTHLAERLRYPKLMNGGIKPPAKRSQSKGQRF